MSGETNVTVPEGIPLGDLASRLLADATGEAKLEYRRVFDTAHDQARRRLQEPLTPEDHETTAALADGTRLCSEVIDQVWNALHP